MYIVCSVSINSFLPDNIHNIIYIFFIFKILTVASTPVAICVYMLVGLRILHSFLIVSSCTEYEKIDKLKCKLQAQKDYY